ncbi:MAG: bifunctional metallophosphatase/5'-nucleotidase [Candidatus Eiseniibacteriota bacterium]
MPTTPPHVTLLFTGDLHGCLGSEDPFSGEPRPGGIGRVATLLAAAREQAPDAIYLDLGDLVQGTPASYLHTTERTGEIHPMVRFLNETGCAGMVIGNHDFNFGMHWIEALRRTARFPILGANVLDPEGRPFFDPVLRLERGGLRIAVLGITTPQVPRWEEPWNYRGLTFRDAVETVEEWLPALRREADVIVIAAHMGWEGVTDGGLEDPLPHENAIGEILARTDAADVVLMAHTHEIVERRGKRGTPAVQAGSRGEALGIVELRADGARPLVTSRIVAAGVGVPADPRVAALVEATEREGARRTAEVVGTAAAPFRVAGARYRDNAVLSLVNRVQFWASGARLSSTALFRANEEVREGPITLGDLFRIYPYENDLTILELRVRDLRDYLEQVALTYVGPARNGDPPPLDPRVSLYNHDSIAGCEYVIDPARAPLDRVVRLTFDGEEWPAERTTTMAVTSYRAQGGGGYEPLRRARVVQRTGREIRRILAEYIRERRVIHPEVFDNWRVVGADAR